MLASRMLALALACFGGSSPKGSLPRDLTASARPAAARLPSRRVARFRGHVRGGPRARDPPLDGHHLVVVHDLQRLAVEQLVGDLARADVDLQAAAAVAQAERQP